VLWLRVQSQRDGGPVRGPQYGRPWRKVKVTERRTTQDYARRLRELVDVDYPEAERIRVVQDSLSAHTPGALSSTFPAPEAPQILCRLEFDYTPKHPER
jgi:hypothetical protein